MFMEVSASQDAGELGRIDADQIRVGLKPSNVSSESGFGCWPIAIVSHLIEHRLLAQTAGRPVISPFRGMTGMTSYRASGAHVYAMLPGSRTYAT